MGTSSFFLFLCIIIVIDDDDGSCAIKYEYEAAIVETLLLLGLSDSATIASPPNALLQIQPLSLESERQHHYSPSNLFSSLSASPMASRLVISQHTLLQTLTISFLLTLPFIKSLFF